MKNNLQTVASLLRLQARAEHVDPRKALEDSVNRILAIAAVHEVLTEHREDEVDLGELVERLRAMLVQGLVAGKEVELGARAGVARGSPGDGGRAGLQRALPERPRARWERGRITLARRARRRRARDRGRRRRVDGAPRGTGLSIVEALVRDELGGGFDLRSANGTTATVTFPAG